MTHEPDTQNDPSRALIERCRGLGLSAWDGAVQGAAREGAGPNDQVRDIAGRMAAGALDGPVRLNGGGCLVRLAPENNDGGVGMIAQVPGAPSVEQVVGLLEQSHRDLARACEDARLLDTFSQKLVQAYEENQMIFRVMRLFASHDAPAQQLEVICGLIRDVLRFGWVAVAFNDSPRLIEELRGRTILAGTAPGGTPGVMGEINALARRARETWTNILTVGSHPLATACGGEVLCDPVTHDGVTIGVLLAGGKTGDDAEIASPEMQFFDAIADFIGTFHENAARFEEQRAMAMETLSALTGTIDAKDPYTRGHSERVAWLAAEIALAMGHTPEQAQRIRVAGIVHDIGKIGVPERILCKPGKLDDEEFAAIKRHPQIGYDILKNITLMSDTLPGVLHHHERWDGRGYPHGLAGEAIPLQARIIGLADTFDAMSSSRSYRQAMPRERVLAEIARCSGTQFDPEVAAAFSRVNRGGYDTLLGQQAAAASAAP